MKKLFLIGALVCASAGILASVSYRTTCGIIFTSTGPNGYPGGEEAYNDWLREMNIHFCGEDEMPVRFELAPGEEPILIP